MDGEHVISDKSSKKLPILLRWKKKEGFDNKLIAQKIENTNVKMQGTKRQGQETKEQKIDMKNKQLLESWKDLKRNKGHRTEPDARQSTTDELTKSNWQRRAEMDRTD